VETEALYEAGRCLSCGNCCECDGCLGACPEDAVIKLGPGNRYRFDYDRCTGCRACFEQCPVHSIDMFAEGAPDPPWAFVAPSEEHA
jgi:Pyruvate/2-oxoacid:ferredoxin oxidoreductase delta subunit